MNRQKIIEKVHISMDTQIKKRGYVAPVDVLMDIGTLSKKNYESWHKGSVPYLEKVCHGSLNSLSFTMGVIRKYARELNLKASYTYYKAWGKKGIILRFSKYGKEEIEQLYATHYIVRKQES